MLDYRQRAKTPLNKIAKTIERLSKDEEQVLLAKWQIKKDIKARNDLITAHLPQILQICGKYVSKSRLSMDALVGAATEGYIVACDKFDRSRDVRFVTYASLWAKAKIIVVIRDFKFQGLNGKHVNNHFFLDFDHEDFQFEAKSQPSYEDLESLASIKDAIPKLPARERFVIEKLYYDDSIKTNEDLAAVMGISRERVRQLKERALNSLSVLLDT